MDESGRLGIPVRLLVDNGANYRSQQFSIICAKLGVALIHAKPHQPQLKGKIERFFRTCRAQLIARLNVSDLASLKAMNRRLAGWKGNTISAPIVDWTSKAPLEKWADVSKAVRYPDPRMDLDDPFLFENPRRVQSDRTVSLHGRVFEVDATLIGKRVTLSYDPSRPDASVQVAHQGKVIEQARQVDLYANCFVKRHRRTGALDVDRKPEMPVTKLSMKSLDGNSDSTWNDTDNRSTTIDHTLEAASLFDATAQGEAEVRLKQLLELCGIGCPCDR